MILISKVLFGSVVLATLAGSVLLPDAADVARSLAASLRWPGTAADAKTLQRAADAEAPLAPHGSLHCTGSCDIWALLAQIR